MFSAWSIDCKFFMQISMHYFIFAKTCKWIYLFALKNQKTHLFLCFVHQFISLHYFSITLLKNSSFCAREINFLFCFEFFNLNKNKIKNIFIFPCSVHSLYHPVLTIFTFSISHCLCWIVLDYFISKLQS